MEYILCSNCSKIIGRSNAWNGNELCEQCEIMQSEGKCIEFKAQSKKLIVSGNCGNEEVLKKWLEKIRGFIKNKDKI